MKWFPKKKKELEWRGSRSAQRLWTWWLIAARLLHELRTSVWHNYPSTLQTNTLFHRHTHTHSRANTAAEKLGPSCTTASAPTAFDKVSWLIASQKLLATVGISAPVGVQWGGAPAQWAAAHHQAAIANVLWHLPWCQQIAWAETDHRND